MANLFIRTYTFVDGTTAFGSQVENEFNTVYTVLNNLNVGSTTWGIVSISNAVSVPLVADCAAGSQHIADFKNNNVIKASVSSTGLVTCVGITNSGAAIAAGSQKITGLANGSAATDAAAFGQIPTFAAAVQATETTGGTSSSTSFASIGASATITPLSASHRVKITISGLYQVSATTVEGLIGIAKGTTDLFTTGNTPLAFSPEVASLSGIYSLVWIDSPATTSATTYNTRLAKVGTGSVSIGGAAISGHQTVMILEEIV